MKNRCPFVRMKHIASAALPLVSLIWAPSAVAKDGWDAQISARAVAAKRAVTESEDIDGTGVGVRGEVGYEIDRGATQIRIEADASVFDYSDDSRDTRTSYGGRITVSHELSETLTVELLARQAQNIAALEAVSADQSSIRGQLQWQKGNDRIRVSAEYRSRDYDDAAQSSGEGSRFAAQYNRRFGSYHWLRFDLAHEDMNSDDSLRGFKRTSVSADYSHPISNSMRLRAGIEARQWDYDGRVAQVDGASNPLGTLREDRLIAPEIGISYGSDSRGIYALAKASYEVRESNDERFGSDAPRIQVTLGYRF